MEKEQLQGQYPRIELSTADQSQTKLCPFCAETIQTKAIKCRFCGEYINTDRLRTLQAAESDWQDDADQEQDDWILFAGRPSLFGIVGSVIKGAIVITLAVFLYHYPLEELPFFQIEDGLTQPAYEELVSELPATASVGNSQERWSWLELTEQQKVSVGKYRRITAVGLGCLVGLILFVKIISLKCMYYEVSSNRIEFSRGIFDRRVDNLDMFRVIDLKLRKSLFDCIFGIGTVTLITTDKTDPEFNFRKIRGCRRLYDIIKKASLDADRRAGVVHLE